MKTTLRPWVGMPEVIIIFLITYLILWGYSRALATTLTSLRGDYATLKQSYMIHQRDLPPPPTPTPPPMRQIPERQKWVKPHWWHPDAHRTP